MGSRSGGGSGGGGEMNSHDTGYAGNISEIESLKNIQDPALYKAVKQAISRYHAVLGVAERDIQLAKLDAKVYGIQSTNMAGKSDGILLNSRYFKKGTKQSMTKSIKDAYEKGWLTNTNKAVAHIVTHELAHATWNSSLSGAKQKAAGKEIKSLYKSWSSDSRKSGYGKYSKSNVDEFWAETVTKGIHGKSDKYTKKAINIAKKYKL